ncbi:uncharacterized protein LOC128238918 isoform X1 [Mya arenaria]|uniref:uncharacterized protein LOC128238918 isoform X1 n=1 Tax=Mya arenaria TaxID=6604 RepID=UPI0022E0D9B1|nr:uncharacterized protein LOC128238918 isoform X1 [Mya arenaria]
MKHQDDNMSPESGDKSKMKSISEPGLTLTSPQKIEEGSEPGLTLKSPQKIEEGNPGYKCEKLHQIGLSKSMDFVSETKFVMLNFMGMVPPEMYKGHISTSPDIDIEEDDNDALHHSAVFSKSHPTLTKSKSLSACPGKRRPYLKKLGRLKSLQRKLDSPASEDNLGYKYHKYQHNIPTFDSIDSIVSPQDLDITMFSKHGIVLQSGLRAQRSTRSTPVSPQKTPLSLQRQNSDVSSLEDFSYASDADDEYDGSNASSIMSSRSFSYRDGFLDLRKSLHTLPTVEDESFEGTQGSVVERTEQDADDHIEDDNIDYDEDDGIEDKADNLEPTQTDQTADAQQMGVAGSGVADRSKLRLNIPCEPVMLDDILLSLQTGLNSEMEELESEFDEALASSSRELSSATGGRLTPITPQSEAALMLARIGDEVRVQYGSQLTTALSSLTPSQIQGLSYPQLRDIASTLIQANVSGWHHVALLMVFGQRLVWDVLQTGQRQVGGIIDNCSQLVADLAADFIVKQGGWNSVMNFDPSQSSSDNQSSADADLEVSEYFRRHRDTVVNRGHESHGSQHIDLHIQAGLHRGNVLLKNNNDKDYENGLASTTSKDPDSISQGKDGDANTVQPTDNDGNERRKSDTPVENDETSGIFSVTDSVDAMKLTDRTDDENNAANNDILLNPVDLRNDSKNDGLREKRSRYASSVGFDFTDTGNDRGEMEQNTENDEDTSMAFLQPADVESGFDDDDDVIFGDQNIENADQLVKDGDQQITNGDQYIKNGNHFEQENHSSELVHDLSDGSQYRAVCVPVDSSQNGDGDRIDVKKVPTYDKTNVNVTQTTPVPCAIKERVGDSESSQNDNNNRYVHSDRNNDDETEIWDNAFEPDENQSKNNNSEEVPLQRGFIQGGDTHNDGHDETYLWLGYGALALTLVAVAVGFGIRKLAL